MMNHRKQTCSTISLSNHCEAESRNFNISNSVQSKCLIWAAKVNRNRQKFGTGDQSRCKNRSWSKNFHTIQVVFIREGETGRFFPDTCRTLSEVSLVLKLASAGTAWLNVKQVYEENKEWRMKAPVLKMFITMLPLVGRSRLHSRSSHTSYLQPRCF